VADTAVRDPQVHELKTDPEPFSALGAKKVEIRRDDRRFAVDDYLRLREHDRTTDAYSGRVLWAQVTHVQRGYGLPFDFVALSLDLEVMAPGTHRCDGTCHEGPRDGDDCPLCCDEPQRMCSNCQSYS